MLQVKSLVSSLNQATTNGVRDAMLIHPDGSIVVMADPSATTGVAPPKHGKEDSERILLAAVVSNVWQTYAAAASQPTDLNCILVDLEQCRVAITGVSGLILCLSSEKTVEYGMLRMKAMGLKQFLREPIAAVVPQA